MSDPLGQPVGDPLIDRLRSVFSAAADPPRAAQMRAYMREQFPFLGIPSTRRRELAREVVRGLPKPTERELTEQEWTRKTTDFKEGVKAWGEKRLPSFLGR